MPALTHTRLGDGVRAITKRLETDGGNVSQLHTVNHHTNIEPAAEPLAQLLAKLFFHESLITKRVLGAW